MIKIEEEEERRFYFTVLSSKVCRGQRLFSKHNISLLIVICPARNPRLLCSTFITYFYWIFRTVQDEPQLNLELFHTRNGMLMCLAAWLLADESY